MNFEDEMDACPAACCLAASRLFREPGKLSSTCGFQRRRPVYRVGDLGGVPRVDSVQSFGCVGQYAYLWATVGHGEGEIGVTEVAYYDLDTSTWKNALRVHYCVDHRLPSYIQFWGCNSN